MNKKECQVMRDLMPLCIDGAASEASRELVVKHVWECEECAKVYAEMQGHLLAPKEAQDYLDAAARKLHRRRRNKRWLLIALTALLTAIVIVAGIWGYQYAFHWSEIPLGLDEYDAVLTRGQDGNVLLNIYVHDPKLQYGVGSQWTKTEDGGYMLTVTPITRLIRAYYDDPVRSLRASDFAHAHWQDGLVYADTSYVYPDPYSEDAVPRQITCIRVVSGKEERIIYQAGDDIPFCSPEMEEYFRVEEEIDARYRSDAMEAFDNELTRLRKLVPEWN